jgi:hypothetical protein
LNGDSAPGDADDAMQIAALAGPFFYRGWFSRQPLTDDFARQIVMQVLR